MEPGLIPVITIFSYLMGSIPSAYIVARLAKGIDIRTVGSHNVGALNTYNQVGIRAATVVLLADALKGVLAISLAMGIDESPCACLYGALGVVVGHNWSVFMGFRGGKGAATVLGVSLAILPLFTFIALLSTFVIGLITRNVVLGAAVGFVLINILTVFTDQGWFQVALCLSLTALVTATYFSRSWRETIAAVHQGRWLDLFAFE